VENNGDGVYLLFVESKPPAKHDILVTDFVGTFRTGQDAINFYDKNYVGSGDPPALIAKFDGIRLAIKYRYEVSLYGDTGGWGESWDTDV
jgi:hypothetical protein